MPDILYSIKRPIGKRKTFGLVAYRLLNRRDKDYLPLRDDIAAEVASINKQYLSNAITRGQAELLLQEIKRREVPKAERNASIISVNQALFDKFWEEEYTIRYLEDDQSIKYDLLKSIRMVEPLNLQTATAAQLQTAIKKGSKDIKEIRRATDRLSQILKYLGRDFKLNKPKAGMLEISYLTFKEFEQVRSRIESDVLKDFATVLFATGVRLGEALAMSPENYRNGDIFVDKQLTKKGIRKLPKREKTGWSMVLAFGDKALKRWFEVEDKGALRYPIYNAVTIASREAFPQNPDKWCSPHDLRHSHAIYLLGKGATLTQISLQLRNRIEVCQKYYTGFAHTPETLEGLKRLIPKEEQD